MCPHLFFAKLADLLLHHADFPVHTVHVLDELLLGEASRYQIQIWIHMVRTSRGDGFQLPHRAPTLLQKNDSKGITVLCQNCTKLNIHESTKPLLIF